MDAQELFGVGGQSASFGIRKKQYVEHVTGIEPVSSAWKAEVIAIIRHVQS